MLYSRWFPLALLSATVLAASSCSMLSARPAARFQIGESLVLVGEEPGHIAFQPLMTKSISVRSTYLDLPETIHYERGRDYQIDNTGAILRTPGSRIPDFRTNMLFGKGNFRHNDYPGFGNGRFFVYVDYSYKQDVRWPTVSFEAGLACLQESRRKLQAGGPFKIVVFGDSISTGCDASERRFVFWQRWSDNLAHRYPNAHIEVVNGATGGDTTVQGLQRLQAKVLSQHPDLVLIGFGMNDHNCEGFGVPLPAFGTNLSSIIKQIRTATSAEVIVYSTFPPNPKWAFGSHNMAAYAKMTEDVARQEHCAFADVYGRWQIIAEHKKPEDILANNINHPNDFGHWIYLQALEAIGL